MREITECTAEVFRRSENRIKERKRNRNRILAMCIPLCLILTVFSATLLQGMIPAGNNDPYKDGDHYYGGGMSNGSGPIKDEYPNTTDVPESLSFSLTWNTYGISSYDSATGKLVKTTDATNPEDYITTLKLDGTQLFAIWELLWELDIETYPDEYDPQGGELSSDPSMTLILTLRDGDKVKTVRAEDIALTYESNDPKGQKFLDTCKGIRDILTATEEWKALPEYEFFYD
ncbi:MAG: hypothetical protein E7633_10220 [Ruminococcaceae bacterium]|nr:hypothetical protein [Oscillospiraceae bacterium]